VEAFLRNAEQILETAAASKDAGASEYLIAISREGTISMQVDDGGAWSLPALAAERGAMAVYRVQRKSRMVRVEGWSYGEKCVLSREISRPATVSYANPQLWLGVESPAVNDRCPQVWNS
jgi:hypothetical protein